MENILRGLIENGQISLTVANTTEIVRRGIELHGLSPASAYIFGKAISALTFISSCLKEEKGEVSLALQCSGKCGNIAVSGNRALHIRGYIDNTVLTGRAERGNERLSLGEEGSFTLVRDDGYNRPFVGTCGFPEDGGLDEIVEEYYKISEQLPTRLKTRVDIDERGNCSFAGVIALQPLPFADEVCLQKINAMHLDELLLDAKGKALAVFAKERFPSLGNGEKRLAKYQCNCSREYLTEILVSLGRAQFEDIVRTEGAVRVHCHYCNRDYEFTAKDADVLFPKRV